MILKTFFGKSRLRCVCWSIIPKTFCARVGSLTPWRWAMQTACALINEVYLPAFLGADVTWDLSCDRKQACHCRAGAVCRPFPLHLLYDSAKPSPGWAGLWRPAWAVAHVVAREALRATGVTHDTLAIAKILVTHRPSRSVCRAIDDGSCETSWELLSSFMKTHRESVFRKHTSVFWVI